MSTGLADLPLFRTGRANPEREAWEDIAGDLSEIRKHYLERIRSRMVRLFRSREREVGEERAFVTPDDARQYFEEALHPPPPEVLSRNFLALVFRPSDWVRVGWVQSRTKGSHGNRLGMYRWNPDPDQRPPAEGSL